MHLCLLNVGTVRVWRDERAQMPAFIAASWWDFRRKFAVRSKRLAGNRATEAPSLIAQYDAMCPVEITGTIQKGVDPFGPRYA